MFYHINGIFWYFFWQFQLTSSRNALLKNFFQEKVFVRVRVLQTKLANNRSLKKWKLSVIDSQIQKAMWSPRKKDTEPSLILFIRSYQYRNDISSFRVFFLYWKPLRWLSNLSWWLWNCPHISYNSYMFKYRVFRLKIVKTLSW